MNLFVCQENEELILEVFKVPGNCVSSFQCDDKPTLYVNVKKSKEDSE